MKPKIQPKRPVLPDADPANRIWGIWDEEEDYPPMEVFDTVEEADEYLKKNAPPEEKKK